MLESGTQQFGLVRRAEQAAEQAVEREVVARRQRMRDEDVGNETREHVDHRLLVLVDVDNEMGGRQPADLFHVDVLGAADFRDIAHDIGRVDAKTRAADQRRGKTEVAQQFGDRWHERHDACRAGCDRKMFATDGIDEFHGLA